MHKHIVIIIPGLGDQVKQLKLITAHFRNHGFELIVHNIGWNDFDADFAPKLEELVNLIDTCTRSGNRVSLIGTSAGGSAVLNAFSQRKKEVYKVISVSGLLRPSEEKGWRSYEARTKSSKPFAQSVKLFASREKTLSGQDRKRIMTTYPLFGDELVAPDAAIMPGATNITIPSAEHVISIALTLTLFSKPIFEFLK
jgi:hypothetical protein